MKTAVAIRDFARFFVSFFFICSIVIFSEFDLIDNALNKVTILEKIYVYSIIPLLILCPFAFMEISSGSSATLLKSNFWVSLLIFGVGSIACYWLSIDHRNRHASGAILFGAVLATLGWIITQRNTVRSARKQHTFNIIIQLQMNENIRYHLTNILFKYPIGRNILVSDCSDLQAEKLIWYSEKKDLDKKASYPIQDSISWIANYYEFVAVAVFSGDLDEGIMKNTVRSSICRFYIKTSGYIYKIRAIDTNKKALENYHNLFISWATPTELEEYRKVISSQ